LVSVAQTVLKLTSPGVPDIYQGNEIWDLSLVDPDNRRPVDFAARKALLETLGLLVQGSATDLPRQLRELLATAADGRIKLYVTAKTLRLRGQKRKTFASNSYEPIPVGGEHAPAICAFRRGEGPDSVLVAVCIRPTKVAAGEETVPVGAKFWTDTFVTLPNSTPKALWRNALTGEQVRVAACGDNAGVWAKDVFAVLPVAVLEPVPDSPGPPPDGRPK
jgi:(1->4)-alpha-D-glucan 1-alpha-D-glucosylmutase